MYKLTRYLLSLILFVSSPSARLLAQGTFTGYRTTTAVSISNRSFPAGENWNNPGNAATDDNTYATFSNTALLIGGTQRISNYLELKNFGFDIPLGQEIIGVEVEVRKFSSDNSGTNWTRDHEIKLVKGGLVVGVNRAQTTTNWASAETRSFYGSSNDRWGTTLTRDEVNSPDFGVVVAIQSQSAGLLLPTVISYIDQVRIRVYYQPSVLPVKLTAFSASLNKNGKLTVNWQTAAETNNSHFIVQQSIDGKTWTNLVRKDAALNASAGATYNLTINMGTMALAGFSLLGILLFPFSQKRNRRLVAVAVMALFAISCAKEGGLDQINLGTNKSSLPRTVYLRLAQFDLDGTVTYSEPLLVKPQ